MKTESNRAFMAKKKSIFVLTAVAALFLVSCKENPYIAGPGADDPRIPDSIPVLVPDTDGIVISIDSAIAICNSLPDGGETAEIYKIRGMVTANTTHPFEVPGRTNITFSISDNNAKTSLACYYIKNLNNRNFQKGSQVPLAGSQITVIGKLTKYVNSSGTKRTPELKDGFITRIDHMVSLTFNGCPEPKEGELSVNGAIQVSDSIGKGKTTSGTYKIRGVVVTKDMPSEADLQSYGNFSFTISSDGATYATCFRLKGKNNGKFTAYNQLEIGDTILVNAKIQNYNGICEPTLGYVEESTNPNF